MDHPTIELVDDKGNPIPDTKVPLSNVVYADGWFPDDIFWTFGTVRVVGGFILCGDIPTFMERFRTFRLDRLHVGSTAQLIWPYDWDDQPTETMPIMEERI